ncbi:uncharacterized protein LOC124176835 isoform X1 [Neodiprion fabricii]|uniref:uncharacterized protein LOC124176835 isoform X1 n=1 Tax=Neodiprion fabricii TaxID=2872261 RepID=UPI001ED93B26|nr:uncharacterized protein LOC124176835 isoform X1 [Neodiprion fabricii]XP_046414540.1 uncharacterized protein LOC124176835 isoform X1 [Neodiprion fabricii]XP_046414541.1 uncharacterized protein LOC124176835 isoform X1 [Neodiprion fabricii]XP_046414542.1 uncharacterized protein LOC124176835 isoform X1 [Neodiprion fabricii]
MAGGSGRYRQGGRLEKVNPQLYNSHLYPRHTSEPPVVTETFKQRQRIETVRTRLKNINILHERIQRIFTDSLHSDLEILIDCKVIRTNQCIVRTRSPHFYHLLEPYFVYDSSLVKCALDVPGKFRHIENFLRLLYTNSDPSQEELTLVQLISDTLQSEESAERDSFSRKLSYDNCLWNTSDIKTNFGRCYRNATVDVSPTSSDMADSGLETGSVSPRDNSVSETSGPDLDESHATGDFSTDEDSNKVTLRGSGAEECNKISLNEQHTNALNIDNTTSYTDKSARLLEKKHGADIIGSDATCSFVRIEPQCGGNLRELDSSGSSDENAQKLQERAELEISSYENHVLDDPFYESESETDENEKTNSFVPTESFEFIDPVNMSPLNSDPEKALQKYESFNKQDDEKLNPNPEARSMTMEELRHELSHSNDLPIKKSSSSTSSYYFIDASSLNDEEEVAIVDNLHERDLGSRIPSYIPSCVNRNSNDDENPIFQPEEQHHRLTGTRRLSTFQSGHEKVAEFEKELKLTERLEPLIELRKVKRLDSTSEDKADSEKEKSTEKETLVVEIKEADSGESARASPCPDNSRGISNNKPNRCEESGVLLEAVSKDPVEQEKNVVTEETEAIEPRRPSLIRRNTFELDPNDEKLSILRQEYERRQGSLVFQNSIPQYSGHRVDGDSCSDVPVMDDTWIKPVDVCLDMRQPTIVTCAVVSIASLDSQDCRNMQELSSSFCAEKSISLNSEESIINQPLAPETRESTKAIEVPKRSKCDETTPIVSGGAAATDYSKVTDSPIVRRKTESTPIVSGGSVLMDEPEVKVKPVRMCSSLTSWVVDMRNPVKEDVELVESDKMQETMSQSLSNVESMQKNEKKFKSPERLGSLGFFIDLNEAESCGESLTTSEKAESQPKSKLRDQCGEQSGNGKSYCEFFIDISEKSKVSPTEKKDVHVTARNAGQNVSRGCDKRNIFSMFIDLNDSKSSNGKCITYNTKTELREKTIDEESTSAASKSFNSENAAIIEKAKPNNGNSDENGSSSEKDQSSTDQKGSREQNKQSIFMFIESDSPVVRRRTLSSSRPAFKRHSWNVDKGGTANGNGHIGKEAVYRKEHKRAHSLSVDRGDLRKNQTKTSNSSHSLSEAARADTLNGLNSTKRLQEQDNNSRNMDTSTEDVFEYDNRDTPPNSHIEIFNEELRASVKQHDYQELISTEVTENFDAETKAYEEEYSEVSVWDKTGTESTDGPDHTRKSETFDISSGSGSGPSPRSDHHDSELSEMMNAEEQKPSNKSQTVPPVGYKIFETQKSLNAKIKKIESELTNHDCGAVKLVGHHSRSATNTKREEKMFDQGPHGNKSAPSNPSGSSFVRLSDLDKTPVRFHTSDIINTKDERVTYRMSTSIPETSWIESKLVMSRSTGPLRNVSRGKFASPMTTSLPPKQKSPLDDLGNDGDGEGVISESDLSSMQSSMGRSGAEGSTEETETSSLVGTKPYNRLGEDLLRMFLEEINPDVTIDVSGRRIRAHKCILSSRCQYFAAILSGGWVESAGNVIALQGYSYNSVHFALCHIYSGESNIPETISIVELATLADMLCLEGLKEVISYTLKVKYCHLFHKPCQICAVGVLECMPLAAAYGLDEVYRKSLRWITRHFVRIWPCKAFATLPRELMDKCYHQHIVHMSTDNVLQTMMDCDKLLATLPNVRWAEPVFRLVSNLLETSVKFLSDNFSGLLGNEKFQALGREFSWNISRLEDNILAAADRLPPEQACKSYAKLHKMLLTAQSEDIPLERKWAQQFIEFLKKIHSHVEKCLVREAPRAARSTMWLKMDLELRRRIQELACLVILPHETSKRQSRHSNFLKEPRATSSRTSASRSVELRKVKMVMSEHNDKTLKQVAPPAPQTKKIPLSKPKTDPLDRKLPHEKLIASEISSRPRSWPNKIEVKPRYLEPRNKSVAKEVTPQAPPEKMIQHRRKNLISSSDSSRTSSPAMKRAVDKKAAAKMKLPIKKDVKALSSDSLADSNADKASNRKDPTSKSCGITRPESPLLKQKETEIGLSIDSLAEAKKKPVVKKTMTKMDTSMSTDSLMTEVTGTPKSTVSNKLSPTLGNRSMNRSQTRERGVKKTSPPIQHKSPLTIVRRAPRSIESSTAASRNRALPVTPYHGSPSLRRNLLDAAKTPDIPGRVVQTTTGSRSTARQATLQLSGASNLRKERKGTLSNQPTVESPKKLSPKSNGAVRANKSGIVGNKKTTGKMVDDKIKTTCHNGEAVKQPTVGSRSGTFLKDEPSILKKSDIKSSEANV